MKMLKNKIQEDIKAMEADDVGKFYTIIAAIAMVFVLFFSTNLIGGGRKPMFMNFQKLLFYHSLNTNEYYLVAVATDDATRPGNLDTMNVHIRIEMINGESILIDNDDLIIGCLGLMYNQVIGRKATLFRFNLLIDNSGSIDKLSYMYVQQTLTRFIELIPLVFEAQIIMFAESIQLKTKFTKDKELLIDAIKRPLPRGSATALFDAISMGVNELKHEKDDIPLRFVLILTDGKNNASVYNPDSHAFKNKIINECREHNILLFIVGVTDSVNSQLLNDIAQFGFYRHIKSFADIDKAFQMILNIIKDTYVFKIPAIGNYQNIKTLYIVKKISGGRFETIQDIIVH
jgi:hypothetical protein